MKLTDIQLKILLQLQQGEMITIDRHNCVWLGGYPVQAQTRYLFTERRLITRLDKTKSIEAHGNGFILSPSGAKILKEIPQKRIEKINAATFTDNA